MSVFDLQTAELFLGDLISRPLTVEHVCIQPKVCERQPRRHSQDLALPAAGVEERHSGHGCQAARVRQRNTDYVTATWQGRGSGALEHFVKSLLDKHSC